MRKTKRILSLLLCVCMTVVLLPTTAFAAGESTITEGSAALQTGVNTSTAATVYYGKDSGCNPYAWRVIGYNGTGVATASGNMTLIAAGNPLQSAFDSSATSNAYANSTLRAKVEEIAAGLSGTEQLAVVKRTLASGTYNGSDTDCVAGDAVSNALLWPLSTAEADSMEASLRVVDPEHTSLATSYWWLRSPGSSDDLAAGVDGGGFVGHGGGSIGGEFGVRPAFNLNLESVLFTSAAAGGKSSGAVGAAALNSVSTTTPTTGWKLTLKDNAEDNGRKNFAITTTALSATEATINYSGAKVGENEYISAIIKDSSNSNSIKYYGRILQLDGTTSGATGTVTVNIPSGVTLGSNTTLQLFNEQHNGDYKTDYASDLKTVTEPTAATYTYTPLPDPITENGVMATVTFDKTSPQAEGTAVTATVTLTGTATAAGTHSVNLTSTKAGLSGTAQTATVTAGQNLTATPVTKTFTFTVPAENVDDLTLTHDFAATSTPSTTVPAIQLGTSGIVKTDKVYSGNYSDSPVLWRVLDTKTNREGAKEGDGLFLLSDVVLGTGQRGDVYFDNTREPKTNKWQGSDAQIWCNDFEMNSLSANELAAIIKTDKDDSEYKISIKNLSFAAAAGILNDDQVFFLSAEEAKKSDYGFTNDSSRIANYGESAGVWWLRSPSAVYDNFAGVVERDGTVNDEYSHDDWAARPAFNLNLSSVLFTSAVAGGKSSAAALSSVSTTTPTEGWKLTLKDTARTFAAAATAYDSTSKIVTVAYSGAEVGTNEYISAIIKDSRDNIKYYGRMAQPTAANGTLTINLSGKYNSGDTLQVFSEQYNGDYKTDYASEPAEVTLTKNAYAITNNLTNLTSGNSSTYRLMSETTDYAATLSAAKGYLLPDTITVTGVSNYTYDSTSGALSIASADITGDITITATGVAKTYTATITPDGKTFDSKTVGYSPVAAETFTIKSTGNQALANLAVTLDGANAAAFTLVAPTATSLDASGGTNTSTTFIVKPNDKLIVGTYTANIKVKADSMTEISKTVSFTVSSAPSSSSSGSDNSDTVYSFTSGANAIWNKGAAKGLTITCNGPFNRFSGLWVDGSAISSDKYTAVSGSTIVTSKPEYLKTLSVGAHTLRLIYKDGYAQTNFTVKAAEHSNPQTGVDMNFTDVKNGDWFYEDVAYVFTKGLMKGTSTTTFSPNANTTRGMIVAILYRMAGAPAVSGGNAFNDVKSGSYYEDAITWAAANGIVGGYGGGKFGPDDSITREQLATILYNYAKFKGYDVSVGKNTNILSYTDAESIGKWAIPAMQWACGAGLIKGNGENLMPTGSATRAQFAAILHRFMESMEK